MDYNVLSQLVISGQSIRQIAEATNHSPTTVRHWLTKYGLRSAGKSGRRPRASQTGTKHCTACNQTLPISEFYTYRSKKKLSGWCKHCSTQVSLMRQRENKERAVSLHGGACKLCGYCGYIGALEWHHPDPTGKDPGYSSLKTAAWDTYWNEVSQCILLCANCHREEHARLRSDLLS